MEIRRLLTATTPYLQKASLAETQNLYVAETVGIQPEENRSLLGLYYIKDSYPSPAVDVLKYIEDFYFRTDADTLHDIFLEMTTIRL